MKIHSITLVLGLIVVPGCSTIATSHDYDTAFDFSSLKAYAWSKVSGDVGMNDLIVRRVRSAVNRVLGAKGYVEGTEAPDFLVSAHGGTRSKVNVSQPHYGRRGWGHGGVDVYQYDEGTLSIDVTDAKTKQLVWRGTATKVLSTNPTPEKVEQTINLAVDKIFEKFPPGMAPRPQEK